MKVMKAESMELSVRLLFAISFSIIVLWCRPCYSVKVTHDDYYDRTNAPTPRPSWKFQGKSAAPSYTPKPSRSSKPTTKSQWKTRSPTQNAALRPTYNPTTFAPTTVSSGTYRVNSEADSATYAEIMSCANPKKDKQMCTLRAAWASCVSFIQAGFYTTQQNGFEYRCDILLDELVLNRKIPTITMTRTATNRNEGLVLSLDYPLPSSLTSVSATIHMDGFGAEIIGDNSNMKFIDIDSSSKITEGTPPALNFIMRNFTIRNFGTLSDATMTRAADLSGGAISFQGSANRRSNQDYTGDLPSAPSKLIISNVNFYGCKSPMSGGGVYFTQTSYSLISDCTFSDNYAYSRRGGGGMTIGVLNSNIYILRNIFSNNFVFDGSGGGMLVEGTNQHIVIRDCLVANNIAGKATDNLNSMNHGGGGGGISINAFGGIAKGSTDILIQNVTFTRNNCTGVGNGGGLIVTFYNRDLVFKDLKFLGNNAIHFGGGASVDVGINNISLYNCDFIGNTLNLNTRQRGFSYGGGLSIGRTSQGSEGYYAVISNVKILNCNFISNRAILGGGVYTENVVHATIRNVLIKKNTAGGEGGGIYMLHSRYFNFTNTNFIGNSAVYKGGGGASLNANNLLTSFHNCSFIDNSCHSQSSKSGGGCLAIGDDNYNTSLSNILFSSCSSSTNGGAIFLHGTNVGLNIQASSFYNNSARNNGGALFLYGDNNATMLRDVIFEYNAANTGSGGAIYLNKQNCDFKIMNAEYKSNSAGNSGGGIVILNSNSNFMCANAKFINNSALSSGSAILISTSNSDVTFAMSSFQGNVVKSTDLLYSYGGSIFLNFNNYNIRTSNCLFIDNLSSKGSAVSVNSSNTLFIEKSYFSQNRALLGDGGALNAELGNSIELTHNTFSFNSASSSKIGGGNGGALYISNRNSVVSRFNTYLKNSGKNGGGVYIGQQVSLMVHSDTYTSNTAQDSGGAIYSNQINLITVQSSVFNHNRAGASLESMESSAGAMYVGNSHNPLIFFNVSFEDNSAGSCGALSVGFASVPEIGASQFVGNVAIVNGGALCLLATTGAIISHVTLAKNVAGMRGGALYENGDSGTILDNSDIYSNEAAFGSALYIQPPLTLSRSPSSIETTATTTDSNTDTLQQPDASVSLTLTDNYFGLNKAAAGGTIFWLNNSVKASMEPKNLRFATPLNTAPGQNLGDFVGTDGIPTQPAHGCRGSGDCPQFHVHTIYPKGTVYGSSYFLPVYCSFQAVGPVSLGYCQETRLGTYNLNLYSNSSSRNGDGKTLVASQLNVDDCAWINLNMPLIVKDASDMTFKLSQKCGGDVTKDTGFYIYMGSSFNAGGLNCTGHTALNGYIYTRPNRVTTRGGNIWYSNQAAYGEKWATQAVKVRFNMHSPSDITIQSYSDPVRFPQGILLDSYDQVTKGPFQANIEGSIARTSPVTACAPRQPETGIITGKLTGTSTTDGILNMNGMVVSCFPGKSIQVNISLTTLDSGGHAISAIFNVTSRSCVDGEYLKDYACTPCRIGTYSLQQDPDDWIKTMCLPCPKYAVVCEKNLIYVPPGMWRNGYYSTTLQSCPKVDGCKGGTIRHANESANTLCKVGYAGPLCSVCAKGYYTSSKQQCVACSAAASPLIEMILIPVLLFGVLLFSVFWGSAAMNSAIDYLKGSSTGITSTSMPTQEGLDSSSSIKAVGVDNDSDKGFELGEVKSSVEGKKNVTDGNYHNNDKDDKEKINANANGNANGKKNGNDNENGGGHILSSGFRMSSSLWESYVKKVHLATASLKHYKPSKDDLTAFATFFFPKLKICVALFQILGSFPVVLSIIFPRRSKSLISAFRTINFLSLNIGTPQCSLNYRFDYIDSLIVQTLVPIAICFLLLLAYRLHIRRVDSRSLKLKARLKFLQNQHQQHEMALYSTVIEDLHKHIEECNEEKENLRHEYFLVFMLVTYFVLPPVSTSIAGAFPCVNIDPDNVYPDRDSSFLRADMSVSCSSRRYQVGFIFASLMSCVYPFGIPFFYLYVLSKNRVDIQNRSLFVEENDEGGRVEEASGTHTMEPFKINTITNANIVNSNVNSNANSRDMKNEYFSQTNEMHSAKINTSKQPATTEDVVVTTTTTSSPIHPLGTHSDISAASTSEDHAATSHAQPKRRPTLKVAMDMVISTTKRAIQPTNNNNKKKKRIQSIRPQRTFIITYLEIEILYKSYKESFWWFEIVETSRRLLFTAALSVIGEGTIYQLIFGILLAVLYIKVYVSVNPYFSTQDGVLQEIAQFQVFLTLFMCLLLTTEDISSSPDAINAIDIVLVCVNLLCPLTIVHFAAYQFIPLYRNTLQNIHSKISTLFAFMNPNKSDAGVLAHSHSHAHAHAHSHTRRGSIENVVVPGSSENTLFVSETNNYKL